MKFSQIWSHCLTIKNVNCYVRQSYIDIYPFIVLTVRLSALPNEAIPKFLCQQWPLWCIKLKWRFTVYNVQNCTRRLSAKQHFKNISRIEWLVIIVMDWINGQYSVVSSAPTILPPRVWVPSTPSTLLSFAVFVLYLPCEKEENKQEEAGFGPFKKMANTVRFF